MTPPVNTRASQRKRFVTNARRVSGAELAAGSSEVTGATMDMYELGSRAGLDGQPDQRDESSATRRPSRRHAVALSPDLSGAPLPLDAPLA